VHWRSRVIPSISLEKTTGDRALNLKGKGGRDRTVDFERSGTRKWKSLADSDADYDQIMKALREKSEALLEAIAVKAKTM
jgi:hypothetical protein